MLLKKLSLINFRNFTEKKVNINRSLTLIIGRNSLGKTNLLEGIYFLFNGVGFRETKEEELILFKENSSLIEGVVANKDELFNFSVKLSLNSGGLRKRFFINKTEKRHFQYLSEQLKTVLFSPDQINIITGSPSLRREYFNRIISVFDLNYKKKLINYEAALRKRNRVLESKQSTVQLDEELKFWDSYLIEQGSYLTKKRGEYVDYLNSNRRLDSKDFSIIYLKNEINDDKLKEKRELEVRLKKTLIGPQKDDFQIIIKSSGIEKNIQSFGSRSEQRLGVFWLKVSEIRYLENHFKTKPIILLDDIFSELDQSNQKIIFPLIKEYQTIATSIELPDDGLHHAIYL